MPEKDNGLTLGITWHASKPDKPRIGDAYYDEKEECGMVYAKAKSNLLIFAAPHWYKFTTPLGEQK